MSNNIEKIKIFYHDLIKVSKLTKTKNKKLKIFMLAIILNLMVFFDITIIIYFANFFSSSSQYENTLINFFLERNYFLPIFVLLRFTSIYFEKIITTNLQIDIEKNLRVYLVEEVFDRGNVSVSDAYYYVNTLCAQVGGFYSTLAAFFGSIIQILAFTAYLLFTNFETVIIFSLGSVLLFVPTLYLTKQGRKFAHIAYEYGQEISSDVEKILDNLFLIKILGEVKNEINKFNQSLNGFYKARINDIKVGTISALMPNFFTLFFLSILLVFFNFVKFLTLDFIGILLRLFQSLGIFNRNIHTVSSFHVYLEKLYEIEKNKDLVYSENYILNPENQHSVEFQNVSFKYLGSDELLFENINLIIEKGKHTIITGANGSGKSTLLGLMSGIFYPNQGKVQVSSNKIGYVSATPLIINSNLRTNLIYGNNQKNIEDEILIKYIESFKLFSDNSKVDLERSVSNKTLSMGQMQKIGFIRALASGIEVLILDESTSNLDLESKELIYKILSDEKITIINSTHSKNDFLKYDKHLEIIFDEGNRNIVSR